MKTKDQNLKALSIPAMISGLFGVTEPAIYGITLPLKKPFIMSCIAAAVGGGIIGIFGTVIYQVGGMGIFGIPTFINPETGMDSAFWGAIIAAVVGFALGLVLTFAFGFEKETTSSKASAKSKKALS